MKTLIDLKTLTGLLILFTFSFTQAQVGIGTTTPAYTFQVVNTGNIGATSLAESTNSGTDGVSLSGFNSSATNPYNAIEGVTSYSGTTFTPAGVFGLAIYGGSGNSNTIGVFGSSNEWQGTGVIGSRFNSGGPDQGWGGQFYNDLGYTGFFGAISDERTKKNITQINGALSIISQLNPVTYFYDYDKYPYMGLNTEMEYGFIAQEVREVLPEIVRDKNLNTNATAEIKPKQGISNSHEQFVVMDYTRIIPILTKAIKEQQSLIDNQNSKIQDLEDKVLLLESKLNVLLENQD
ncbi:tail fiber domain-containing protein [uncultured Psychroserpens sp.]|uniref:tail fiber domain-containing protein n=1 Tax=uncultured Psychroserpens sp. TaxID=255436 RepID=UPI00261352D2|nr:tail fiber domain-containing protein [uncultured Psychroserpens sp.]